MAITERAVYVGGHFGFEESPTAPDPWPGLDNVGYGTGQGLAGYGLGDAVVRRDHIGALNPADGKALEWNPGSNSFEGNKAMEATARGLFVGGDGMYQGGKNTGRVAFYDFNTDPAADGGRHHHRHPDRGPRRPVRRPVHHPGPGHRDRPQVRRVQVEIQDRNTKQYLQDDLVTWGGANNVYASLASRQRGLDGLVPAGHRHRQPRAPADGQDLRRQRRQRRRPRRSRRSSRSASTTRPRPPASTGPAASVLTSTTFIATGTANDDKGVNALTYWFRDDNNQYLQEDGSVSSSFNTFRGTPDVVGATSATWQYEVTLPHEGAWRMSATAIDNNGQSDLRQRRPATG